MLPAVLTRSRIVFAAAALLATACSSSAVDESPDAAPETSVAVTTTVPPSTTTSESPEATEPAASEPEATEPGQPEPEQQPVEPPDPEGVGDSFYPKLGNPGYDVLHYDIDLDVEPSAKHHLGADRDHGPGHRRISPSSTWTCRAWRSTR